MDYYPINNGSIIFLIALYFILFHFITANLSNGIFIEQYQYNNNFKYYKNKIFQSSEYYK